MGDCSISVGGDKTESSLSVLTHGSMVRMKLRTISMVLFRENSKNFIFAWLTFTHWLSLVGVWFYYGFKRGYLHVTFRLTHFAWRTTARPIFTAPGPMSWNCVSRWFQRKNCSRNIENTTEVGGWRRGGEGGKGERCKFRCKHFLGLNPTHIFFLLAAFYDWLQHKSVSGSSFIK
jgi:hypothetical protein